MLRRRLVPFSSSLPHPTHLATSFADGGKSVDIAAGAEVTLTTDPAFKDKGTAEKV